MYQTYFCCTCLYSAGTILSISRKGKLKPLEIVEEDTTGQYVDFFINMGKVDDAIDIGIASEFVCKLYGQVKENDVDQARFSKLMKMSGKVNKVTVSYRISQPKCGS